jgi:hypothetical protein
MALRSVRRSKNAAVDKRKGVEMYYSRDRISMCNVCKREYTSFHFEARPGLKVFVCADCLDSAKSNFIWICLNCGNSYHRAKEVVMGRIYDYGIKEASFLYENQIIHGIEACVHCNPELILEYADKLGNAFCERKY